MLHLPWQGSWQVRAGKLTEPLQLQGAHLPLLAWEHQGQWTVARFAIPEDDAIWDLRLQQQKHQLSVTLIGQTRAEPIWAVSHAADRQQMVQMTQALLAPAAPTQAPEAVTAQFIFDIHNVRGTLVQSFGEVEEFVEELADRRLARGALIYLPGWSGPYDGNYPDYQPAPDAGGDEGLARLARTAKRHGARVLPHLNHWALSQTRREAYRHFLPHQLRDLHGRKAGWTGCLLMNLSWPLDYIDPACPLWIEHFSARLGHLESLGVEAAQLDQVAPPLGDNWRRSTRTFVREIARRHPRMSFCSESVHADLLGALRYAQLWGPVWSAMPEELRLAPSPLLADMVRPWTAVVGHLATPAPYPAAYAWTQYLVLAELGPARFFQKVWKHHEAAHVAPTVRLVATAAHRSRNARVLDRLFPRP